MENIVLFENSTNCWLYISNTNVKMYIPPPQYQSIHIAHCSWDQHSLYLCICIFVFACLTTQNGLWVDFFGTEPEGERGEAIWLNMENPCWSVLSWRAWLVGDFGGVGWGGEKLKSTRQPQTLVVSRTKWIAVSLIFQYMSVEAHGLVWWGGEGANVAKVLQVWQSNITLEYVLGYKDG